MMDELYDVDSMGNAIIEKAHEDYIEALLLEHKAVLMLNRAMRLKQSVLSFYGNKWYYSLTNVDPALLIDTARKQADYIIWQRNHHCDTCTIGTEKCLHNVERVNWQKWANGARSCPMDRERRSKEKKKEDD